MRGAVTWKSVVGTNVASDALSHVASAGVIGGSVIVIGEDYGEGASILQERTHSAALKSSIPLLDPRNSLDAFARFVEEGFGLSEACNEPVFFSIRIRACHMRGTLRCRDNVRPAISMLSPLTAPSFSLDRINLPPFTYQMEAQKFEKRRRPAATSPSGDSTSISAATRTTWGSSCRVGSGTRRSAGCTCSASPTRVAARPSRSWCSTPSTRWFRKS
jgi:indolepyruvate ferredoxin oxidoreductase alpha subunit